MMMKKLKHSQRTKKVAEEVEQLQPQAKKKAEKKKEAMLAQFLLDLDKLDPKP